MSEDSWDVLIRPTNVVDKIVLDRISIIMSCMTVSSALLFEGSIDFSRLEEAFKSISHHQPWLFCSLKVSENEVFVSPRTEDDEAAEIQPFPGYFRVEFCKSASNFDHSNFNINSLTPSKVHEKMIRVDLAMASVQDLPICAFRVTQFTDHFSIGYRMNHAFYDQNSIVYFLTYLAEVYSNGNSISIPKPVFQPRSTIIPNDYPPFSTLEEFNAAAPKGYTSTPFAGGQFGAAKSVKFILNKGEISKMRNSSTSGSKIISSNDIIHGLLLKIVEKFNSNRVIKSTEEIKYRVLFARNMRKPLKLSAEAVGDYVRLQCIELSEPDVKKFDLVGLSMISRDSIREDIADKYIRECKWFLEYKDRYGSLCGSPDFMADEGAAVITNWSSFPYENIKFDKSSPAELLLAPTEFTSSQAMFVIVSFKGQGENRSLVITINSLHDEVIIASKAIAEETGLLLLYA